MANNDHLKSAEELLGPEAGADLTSLVELNETLDTLDENNRALFEEIKGRYEALTGKITEILKSDAVTEKKRLVALRKEVEASKQKLFDRFPKFVAEDKAKAEETKLNEKANEKSKDLFALLDTKNQIPTEEAEQFKKYWHHLPANLKLGYLNQLKGALLKDRDPVGILTGFRATLFELSRKDILDRQGLEEMGEFNEPITVEYLGFDKANPNFARPPHKILGGSEKGDIQIDVHGIMRDGKPLVYETKSFTRKLYGHEYGDGESVSARNQLLKYQKAIEIGKIAGATVEIKGRLDYAFLAWAAGENVSSQGAVPDVEIIYNFPLPSGKEFRFVLKRGRGKGLQFENEGSDYSIEDKIIIRGLARSIRDKSITSILQDINIPPDFDHPLVKQEHIDNPQEIRDVDVYNAYDNLRKTNIWKRLKGKAISTKEQDKIPSYDERVNKEFVLKMLSDFQEMLNANPELKARKWAYVVTPERYEEVTAKVMAEVEKVKNYEQNRQSSDEEMERQVVRDISGYKGPKEGFALDVEHILMDVIQNTTKTRDDQKPRSYDDTERFVDLKEFSKHLHEKDRTYVEVVTYDPQNEKQNSTIITGDKAARKTELLEEHSRNLVLENIKRAENRLKMLLKQYEALHKLKSSDGLDDAQQTEYASLQSSLSGYTNGKRVRLEQAKSAITSIEKERDDALAPFQAAMKDIRTRIKAEGPKIKDEIAGNLRSISQQYQSSIFEKKAELLSAYKEIFANSWNDFAVREVSRHEANLMKLIYVITPEGNVKIEEERIRGAADSSRAAHSELAQGRNVYAAGEMVLAKQKDGQWKLTEINNGSGHYRPTQDTLNYAKVVMAEQLGIDPNDQSIVLRNCIFRGIDIDGLPLEFR